MPAVNQQGIKIMEVPPTQINNPEAIKSGLREALNGINPEAVQKLRLAVLAAFGDVDFMKGLSPDGRVALENLQYLKRDLRELKKAIPNIITIPPETTNQPS